MGWVQEGEGALPGEPLGEAQVVVAAAAAIAVVAAVAVAAAAEVAAAAAAAADVVAVAVVAVVAAAAPADGVDWGADVDQGEMAVGAERRAGRGGVAMSLKLGCQMEG